MANYFITNSALAASEQAQNEQNEAAQNEAAEEQSEHRYQVETLEDGRYQLITPDGREVIIDAYQPEAHRLNLLVDGQSFDVVVREEDAGHAVFARGEFHQIEVLNERQRRMREAGGGGRNAGGPDLLSPMAGKVVAVSCAVGDAVDEGDLVVIVEAMKMENDLKAHISGQIAQIHVAAGDTVEVGDLLVSIE